MRSIRPRNPENYDNETDSRIGQSNLMPGNFCLNETLGPCTMVRPSYREGMLVFRPWPQLDYANPSSKLQPARKSRQPHGQTNWLVKVMCVNFMGIPESGHVYSFNLYHPRDLTGRETNPYMIFYRACQRAYRNGSFGVSMHWRGDWNRLMIAEKGKGAAIPKPSPRWYIQGHCYVSGTTVYADRADLDYKPYGLHPDDPLVVFQLSRSVGDALLDMLDIEKNPEEVIPSEQKLPVRDLSEYFYYGSATGIFDESQRTLSSGLILTVYNPKVIRIETKHTSWDGKMENVQDYAVALSRFYKTKDGRKYTADMNAEDVQQIFNKAQFWFDDPDTGDPGILRFLLPEQQVELIARAFSSVASLVEYAFSDHDEYLTNDILAILRKRKTIVLSEEDIEDLQSSEEDSGSNSESVNDRMSKLQQSVSNRNQQNTSQPVSSFTDPMFKNKKKINILDMDSEDLLQEIEERKKAFAIAEQSASADISDDEDAVFGSESSKENQSPVAKKVSGKHQRPAPRPAEAALGEDEFASW